MKIIRFMLAFVFLVMGAGSLGTLASSFLGGNTQIGSFLYASFSYLAFGIPVLYFWLFSILFFGEADSRRIIWPVLTLIPFVFFVIALRLQQWDGYSATASILKDISSIVGKHNGVIVLYTAGILFLFIEILLYNFVFQKITKEQDTICTQEINNQGADREYINARSYDLGKADALSSVRNSYSREQSAPVVPPAHAPVYPPPQLYYPRPYFYNEAAHVQNKKESEEDKIVPPDRTEYIQEHEDSSKDKNSSFVLVFNKNSTYGKKNYAGQGLDNQNSNNNSIDYQFKKEGVHNESQDEKSEDSGTVGRSEAQSAAYSDYAPYKFSDPSYKTSVDPAKYERDAQSSDSNTYIDTLYKKLGMKETDIEDNTDEILSRDIEDSSESDVEVVSISNTNKYQNSNKIASKKRSKGNDKKSSLYSGINDESTELEEYSLNDDYTSDSNSNDTEVVAPGTPTKEQINSQDSEELKVQSSDIESKYLTDESNSTDFTDIVSDDYTQKKNTQSQDELQDDVKETTQSSEFQAVDPHTLKIRSSQANSETDSKEQSHDDDMHEGFDELTELSEELSEKQEARVLDSDPSEFTYEPIFEMHYSTQDHDEGEDLKGLQQHKEHKSTMSLEDIEEIKKISNDNKATRKKNRKGSYAVPIKGLIRPPEERKKYDETINLSIARVLEETLNEFNIDARVRSICRGPVVTMFEILPAAGVRLRRIVELSDNIALRLAAPSIRIVAPIPGKEAVGIEVPNKVRENVAFSELITDRNFSDRDFALPVALGKNISNEIQIIDLARNPHLLIAGATGSGKSVCVNSIICSLLYRCSPEEVKFILIDPKIVELSFYNGISHLLTPVISESAQSIQALRWCVDEMERRYRDLERINVREIKSYNRKLKEMGRSTKEIMSYIVIVIDEFADLMMTCGKEIESLVSRITAKSRAVGIHMVVATQRPSTDVITGLIKSNIPSRISFMVTSKTDSRIILDMNGAENLLGKGDMLYSSASDPFPERIQGPYLSEDEVQNIVEYIRDYTGEPEYISDEIFTEVDEESIRAYGDEDDPLWDAAVEEVIRIKKASASHLQRRFKIGYNRAARLVEDMEDRGIIGPAQGSKAREVLAESA